MKLLTVILTLAIAVVVSAQAENKCPVCGRETVDVTKQKDDLSKPSINLSVWNRSMCANFLFGEGSLICLRDGYAYESRMKQWELSLENPNSFAHPLDHRIREFPLPVREAIKSGTVYSQEFASLDTVEHRLQFWTVMDERYFTKIQEYAKTSGVNLEIERNKAPGEAIIRATMKTQAGQGGVRQPATRPLVK